MLIKVPNDIKLSTTKSIWEFLVSLHVRMLENRLQGLLKYIFLDPRVPDSVDLRWSRSGMGLRMNISNKFPVDADVLVQEPLLCTFPTTFKKFTNLICLRKISHYCISLIINEIKHLLMFLSHMYPFSFKLFMYFAHFLALFNFFLLICKNFLHMKDIGSLSITVW